MKEIGSVHIRFHKEMKKLGYSSVDHPLKEVYGEPTKRKLNKN
jgi:hypothetical protein